MKSNTWLLVFILVANQQMLCIHTNINMNERYYSHLKEQHTYVNYLEEKEAIEKMLKDFRQLSMPDKHSHLQYMQGRPEFAHLSRYFQFAGLFQEKPSLTDTVETLMHLQHHDTLDHNSKIFTPPVIHKKARLTNDLKEFFDQIHQKYDLNALVNKEIEEEIFEKENIDDYFEQIRGKKKIERSGQGFYASGNKKIAGISERDRDTFNQLFTDYIKQVAHGSDWEDKQEDIKVAQKKVKKIVEDRQKKDQDKSIVHDILSHHTNIDLTSHSHEQAIEIGRQIIDASIENNHSYSHLHQFEYISGKIRINNGTQKSSYLQVRQSMNDNDIEEEQNREMKESENNYMMQKQIQDKREKIYNRISFKEQDISNPNKANEEMERKKKEEQEKEQKKKEKKEEEIRNCKLKKDKFVDERPKGIKKILLNTEVEVVNDPNEALTTFPSFIPISLVKGIILLILSIIGQIIHICLPVMGFSARSCPEASSSMINIYQLFQAGNKNKIMIEQMEGFQQFYVKIKSRLYKFLGKKGFVVDAIQKVKYEICSLTMFTLDCSQIWAGCDLMAWLFTNPPILVIPFLAAMPNLAWGNILPGDKPFCFMCCINALTACEGVHWNDLAVCYGLFNIDNLIRMITQINLLLFIVFSFVPGFCDRFIFKINAWRINPIEPKLSAQIKKAKKEIDKDKPVCDSGDDGDDGLLGATNNNTNSSPFKPDYLVNEKAADVYPYEVSDQEKEYQFKNWELDYSPSNKVKTGFKSNLKQKPDLKDYKYLEDKASEMFNRSDKKQKKQSYIQAKAGKMEQSDEKQEKRGNPTRIDGIDASNAVKDQGLNPEGINAP